MRDGNAESQLMRMLMSQLMRMSMRMLMRMLMDGRLGNFPQSVEALRVHVELSERVAFGVSF